jgi:hypothetical protein
MKNWIFGICVLSGSVNVLGQNISGGNISGNFESTFQYLNTDSLISAFQPAEKGLLNSYINVFYVNGNFKAGIRGESYLPRIQGYPNRFDGTGLGMRYVGWGNDFIDITVGHFYEQFGSGMNLRAYEDRNLGYDNAMDGGRLILRPYKGIVIKGVYGRQRYSFEEGRVISSDGVTRGFDGSAHLNEMFKKLDSMGLDLTVGGSFVSKYQKDNSEEYILPENVGSYGGRFDAKYKGFTLNGEYIHKENDPSANNKYIYNTGHAALVNLGYSKKGLGILLTAKSVDNMSFRSDRDKDLTDVFINFLPALNKTHTYNLVATLYPYATRPIGEVAFQGEILYMIPKGSKLGGKYGIPINLNYSSAFMPVQHTTGFNTDEFQSARVTYKGNPFDKSDSLLWQDINANITYKVNKNLSFIASYFNITLNNDVTEVTLGSPGIINSNIGVLETNWKINKKHSLRTELQGLFTKQDKGNWATLVVEYSISPGWFFSVMDQYNYGNKNEDLRIHYLIGSLGYTHDATRIMASYGRQRAGLFCVGGVCRFVPASNGLTLTVSHSF